MTANAGRWHEASFSELMAQAGAPIETQRVRSERWRQARATTNTEHSKTPGDQSRGFVAFALVRFEALDSRKRSSARGSLPAEGATAPTSGRTTIPHPARLAGTPSGLFRIGGKQQWSGRRFRALRTRQQRKSAIGARGEFCVRWRSPAFRSPCACSHSPPTGSSLPPIRLRGSSQWVHPSCQLDQRPRGRTTPRSIELSRAPDRPPRHSAVPAREAGVPTRRAVDGGRRFPIHAIWDLWICISANLGRSERLD
jgi:hypothetical protein